MHHTRRTHNSHNETQRRLKKVLANSPVSRFAPTPHYTYVEYLYDGFFCYVHPYWVDVHSSMHAVYKDAINKSNRFFDSFEEAEFAKTHRFLVKKSKSDGKNSLYKFYKRLVHKWWRRRGFDELTYSLKGSYCSYSEVFW